MTDTGWKPNVGPHGDDIGVGRSFTNGIGVVYPWTLASAAPYRWSFEGRKNGRRVSRSGRCKSIESGKLRAEAAALECDP